MAFLASIDPSAYLSKLAACRGKAVTEDDPARIGNAARGLFQASERTSGTPAT